jgi:hypothetical protein
VSPALVVGLAAALAGLCFLLGLVLGLYRGERARLRDAQNRETYGHPQRAPARAIPQPPTAEERAENYGYDPATLERGIADVMKHAEAQGQRVTREVAKAQVLALLHPDSMIEGAFPS